MRENGFDEKMNRFWEKYECLETFNREYSLNHPKLPEEIIPFLDEVWNVWRAHPASREEIDNNLQVKVQRQTVFRELSRRGK